MLFCGRRYGHRDILAPAIATNVANAPYAPQAHRKHRKHTRAPNRNHAPPNPVGVHAKCAEPACVRRRREPTREPTLEPTREPILEPILEPTREPPVIDGR